MANKGMSAYTHQGEDYTINDPNIANEFDATAAYSAGDFVNFQGNLYQFKVDHAAGAMNYSQVNLVKIGEKVGGTEKDLSDEIAPTGNASENTFEMKNLLSGMIWTYGSALDGTTGEPVSNQYTTEYSISDYIPVTPPFHLYWASWATGTSAVVTYNSSKQIVGKYKSRTHLGSGECYVDDSTVAYIRYQRLPDIAFKHIKQYLYISGNVITNPAGIYGTCKTKDLLSNTQKNIGHALNYNTGASEESVYTADYATTGFIEISTPCRINWAYGFRYDYSGTKIPAICTYDASKNFIHAYFTEGKADGAGSVIEYDDDVKYIRYCLAPTVYCPDGKQYLTVNELDPESTLTYYKSMLSFGDLIHKYIYHGEEQNPGQYTSGYYCTPYIEIPVVPSVITWRAGNANTGVTVEAVAFYDEDHEYLYSAYSPAAKQPGKYYLTDSNAKYIRYNIMPNTTETPYTEQYLRCYVDKLETLEKQVEGIINSSTARNSIVLSKDGTGDFTTWKAATEYCWTHPNTDVFVHHGEYDLVEEYGDDYFAAIPNDYDRQHSIGPECGYNCRYIFSAGAKLVFEYEGNVTNVATFFSPVNIIGSCEFHNMVIECSNCRYCVHEDMPCVILPIPHDVRVKYINCHMTHNGNTLGSYRATWCIGAGGGIDSVSEVDGGEYISSVGSISYHLPSSTENGCCEVWIHDAYCSGNVQQSDYPEEYEGTIYFYVNGCSLPDDVVLGDKAVPRIYNNEIRE